MMWNLKVIATPNPRYAYSNRVYVHKSTFDALSAAAKASGVAMSRDDPTINISVNGSWVFQAW